MTRSAADAAASDALERTDSTLTSAGLHGGTERPRLLEAVWTLLMPEYAHDPPNPVNAIAELVPDSDRQADAAPSDLMGRLVSTMEPLAGFFCDARAPRRDGSFACLDQPEAARSDLIRSSVAIAGHAEADLFLPLLLATRLRCVDVLENLTVVSTCERIVIGPRVLSRRDRRRIRWAASQMFGCWLSPAETARYLDEHLLDCYDSA